MKQNFEPYSHFTLRRMLWEDIHYTRGQEYLSVFAAVCELFEWVKADCFGTVFLDKILFINVSSLAYFSLIWMFVMQARVIKDKNSWFRKV